MKLFCIESSVVKGGRIVEKGQTYDTGDLPKKEDREAYELIAAGRMVELTDTKAVETAKQQIASEAATKAEQKASARRKE